MDNPINALRKFLSGTRGEISLPEFTSFWKSLQDAEKTEYRTAIEQWDGKSEFIPATAEALHSPIALPAAPAA